MAKTYKLKSWLLSNDESLSITLKQPATLEEVRDALRPLSQPVYGELQTSVKARGAKEMTYISSANVTHEISNIHVHHENGKIEVRGDVAFKSKEHQQMVANGIGIMRLRSIVNMGDDRHVLKKIITWDIGSP